MRYLIREAFALAPANSSARGGPECLRYSVSGDVPFAGGDLKGKGVEFSAGISEHDWGRIATFNDTEGNDLQLYEPPKS